MSSTSAGGGVKRRQGAKAPPLDEVPPDLPDAVEAAVRREGALSLKKLTTVKMTRGAEATLQEALLRRGLERTGKHIRVPLTEQLRALIAREPEVPSKALRSRLAGVANVSELKRALFELVLAGEARIVLEGKVELFCRPSEREVSSEHLASLTRLAADLTKLLGKVKPKKGQPPKTLRAEAVERLLFVMEGLLSRGAATASGRPSPPLDILATIRALESPSGAMVFVPDVVRQVGLAGSVESVHEALVAASGRGEVELRPESGVGLLTSEQASLCPRLPDGTCLSYVRRLVR